MDTPEEISNKIKEKVKNIEERLDLVLERTNLNENENLESLVEISQSLCLIEEKLSKLEGNINNLENLSYEERERIIDQKIFKIFTPYILYMKYHLFNE